MTGTKKKLLKQSKTYIGLRVRKGGAMSDDNWRKEFDKEFVKEYPYGNSVDGKDKSKFEPIWNGSEPSPSTIKQFIKDLLAKHSQARVEEESYTPEQIIQAYSIVLSKHGKMFMDELILELKRNFKTELKNTGGKK